MVRTIRRGTWILALAAMLLTAQAIADEAPGYSKPKVRAITAFVRIDPASLDRQVDEALDVLQSAKAEFEKQGYEPRRCAS